MKFSTPYNPVFVPTPTDPGEEIVERAGYRPIEKQVQEMLMAGERLKQYRLGYEYGTEEEIDPADSGDITRRSDFDLVDAQNLSAGIKARSAEKLAEKAKKDAEIKRQDDLKQAKLLLEEEENRKKLELENPGSV